MRISMLLGVMLAVVVIIAITSVNIISDRVDNLQSRTEIGVGGDVPTPVIRRQGEDLVTTLEEDGNFTIFLEALGEAGMLERLSGPEQFTVFAPSDDAFSKVRSDILYPILSDRDLLRAMLSNHIISGSYSYDKLSEGDSFKSLEGGTLRVNNEAVNSAHISKQNLDSSNGVVHVIDEVIMPPEYLLLPPQQT